jgi:exopolysaccharide biosynthesis polyprenyl glycosylphosphotransferase
MLWHRIRGLWNTYHCILAVVLTVVFWTYLVVVSALLKRGDILLSGRFVLYNLAGVAGLAVAAIRERGGAATLLSEGFVHAHSLAFKQTIYVAVTMIVMILAAMDPEESKMLRLSVLAGFLVVFYVVLLICHLFLVRQLANHLFASEEYGQRTLLIGPVEKARDIANWIDETAAFGFGIKGSVPDEDHEESKVLHVTRVLDVAMLDRIVRHEGIKQILLLELPLDQEALDLIVGAANKVGARLLVLNNLPEIFRHPIMFFNLHNRNFISLIPEPLEDPLNRMIKRTMDFLVSLPVVILVLPPLCLLVKIFQAIQSPGPLFYRQTRAGLGGRPFRIFKFRTMRVDKGDSASAQAVAGDPRIYPMGRLLRKTSLDEIPQFLNVFLGDMSIVGPRPHMIIHNRRFSEIMEKYHVRTFAKPGITGLAQMSGFRGEAKNDEDVRARATLDIKYIENWSLPLDFYIIFMTGFKIFKPPPTAY